MQHLLIIYSSPNSLDVVSSLYKSCREVDKLNAFLLGITEKITRSNQETYGTKN